MYLLTCAIGFSAALYFGLNGADLITLNLVSWNGVSWHSDSVTGIFKFISFFIRILPPLYVIGLIPINGITLSNNM